MSRAKRVPCPTCKIEKLPREFYAFSKQGGKADGISYRCIACEKLRQHAKHAAKKATTAKRPATGKSTAKRNS